MKWHGHLTTWSSQSTKQHKAEGNMALSAGILLFGRTYEPTSRLMEISGIQIFGKLTFYFIQENFLFPAVNYVCESKKCTILEEFENASLNLVGDGRFDSPGCSAKCGTYPLSPYQLRCDLCKIVYCRGWLYKSEMVIYSTIYYHTYSMLVYQIDH